jgi:hypothetical protein
VFKLSSPLLPTKLVPDAGSRAPETQLPLLSVSTPTATVAQEKRHGFCLPFTSLCSAILTVEEIPFVRYPTPSGNPGFETDYGAGEANNRGED